jgi:hypothetical protein
MVSLTQKMRIKIFGIELPSIQSPAKLDNVRRQLPEREAVT